MTMIIDNIKAETFGRPRSDRDAVVELVQQINAARAELQEARREYADKIASARLNFDEQAATMRKELVNALIQLDLLRVTMLRAWQRYPNDVLH